MSFSSRVQGLAAAKTNLVHYNGHRTEQFWCQDNPVFLWIIILSLMNLQICESVKIQKTKIKN